MSTPLDRIMDVAECKTQVELAGFLGIKQSSVSDAKRRKTIPSDWLLTLIKKKMVNPEWVISGQGARFLQAAEGEDKIIPPIVCSIEVRPPAECSAQELINELVRRALSHQ